MWRGELELLVCHSHLSTSAILPCPLASTCIFLAWWCDHQTINPGAWPAKSPTRRPPRRYSSRKTYSQGARPSPSATTRDLAARTAAAAARVDPSPAAAVTAGQGPSLALDATAAMAPLARLAAAPRSLTPPSLSPFAPSRSKFPSQPRVPVESAPKAEPDGLKAKTKAAKKHVAAATDFEKVDDYKVSLDDLYHCLRTSPNQGLSKKSAAKRQQETGPNVLPARRQSYYKKLLGYIFGGFCSVLWVGVIVFFICWKPLGNPDPQPYNLAWVFWS
jgi:hypothetical protein